MSEPGRDGVENPLGFPQQDFGTSSNPLPVPPESQTTLLDKNPEH